MTGLWRAYSTREWCREGEKEISRRENGEITEMKVKEIREGRKASAKVKTGESMDNQV